MTCFCDVPLAQAQSTLSAMQFRMTPPQIPLSLRLAAAFGVAMDPNRADIRIAAGVQAIRLPDVTLGGPLANLAMGLQVAGGTFRIDDIPTLEAQMRQAAQSIQSNVLPRIGMLARVQVRPLVNLAIIARLLLDLRARGIDPLDASTLPPPPANLSSTLAMRLTPPQLRMARLAVGLPPLLQLAETLRVPLGDQSAASAMRNRLEALARVQPPPLPLPMPLLLRLAFVLDSLATIREAFGPDAMTPAGLNRIAALLQPYMRLSLPIPMPVLALNEQLATLPPVPPIKAGTDLRNTASSAFFAMTPPRLAIAPFLNVLMALNLSLANLLRRPVLDQCAACNMLAA
jgi:hypothetical protein